MLKQFRQAKQREIARLQAQGPGQPWTGTRPAFAAALEDPGGIAVIAEYKCASPSQGRIRSDLRVEEVARQYQESGARAMSVLTEEDFFCGDIGFLQRADEATGGELPLLRKDFLFDPLQVAATAATPASALLLIVRILPGAIALRQLREQAESLGLDAVVEVFDQQDLQTAREAGARIIQVNARDLDTLKVSREACLRLIGQNPPQSGELWIAASGLARPEHLAAARDAGFAAALVGTALMQAPHPGQALAYLLEDAAVRPQGMGRGQASKTAQDAPQPHGGNFSGLCL